LKVRKQKQNNFNVICKNTTAGISTIANKNLAEKESFPTKNLFPEIQHEF